MKTGDIPLSLMLIKQILVLSAILYVNAESTTFHYVLLAFTSTYYIPALVSKKYNFHKIQLDQGLVISWPFTIIEVIIFYHYGWYDLMLLWPIFSYIDLRITYKGYHL